MPEFFSKILRRGPRGSVSSILSAEDLPPPVNAVYWPNWSIYREKPPSSIDPSSVTHIFYAFVWPKADGTIAFSDAYADQEIEVDGVNGCLAAVAQLKRHNPHIKVLLSVGGGGRGSEEFAAMASKAPTRGTFSVELKRLVKLHGFDGVDIDWEHPSDAEDRTNYLTLLKFLRRSLPPTILLTSALPAAPWMLQSMPLNLVAQELDFLMLMAYDFAGPWSPLSGHHAQLFSRKDSDAADPSALSGAGAVAYATSAGVPPNKLLLGIPVYGRYFPGAGSAGRDYEKPVPEDKATIEYSRLPHNGALEWVDKALCAAYSVGHDGFVSYDNKVTVTAKGKWVRAQGLAGLFYWTTLGDREGDESLVKTGYNAMLNYP